MFTFKKGISYLIIIYLSLQFHFQFSNQNEAKILRLKIAVLSMHTFN